MTDTERAQVLIEALPYIREYYGKTVVVKYGGAAMTDEALKHQVMQDVVLMHFVGINPVLVHGGGPEVSEAMKRAGKEPVFIRGLRVTDAETMEIAEMVLAGKTNKGIVSLIHQHGGRAAGLSGKDGNLFVARKMPGADDLGFVGDVDEVNPHLLETLLAGRYIPVVCSIATGRQGETFNINADHVAGKLAARLRAEKLLLLTDVPGILADVSRPDSLLSVVGQDEARRLLHSGAVDRGMIPKVEACLFALEGGVPRTHILDGRAPHSLLTELFTDRGVGTMIVP
jgi:acetylglutamate kinase